MIPGISGNLLPLHFIAEHLPSPRLRQASLLTSHPLTRHLSTRAPAVPAVPEHLHFRRLWRRIASSCGPATGLRALADVAAMPWLASLGFVAAAAEFGPRTARFELRDAANAGASETRPVALIVAPWAHRSPSIWRDAVAHGRAIRADWCVIVAPPFLQIVDTRAHWTRRFVEFALDVVADHPETFARLAAIASAPALTGAGEGSLRAIVAAAAEFQDAVRADLQTGVAESLDTLERLRLERRESLAIVYRILFLLFVESRDLIPWRHPLYRPAYSIGALCERARLSPRAPGFWPALAAVSRLLRSGCRTPRLDVPPFNGHLFSRSAAPSLERRRSRRAAGASRTSRGALEDEAVGRALVSLSTRRTRQGRELIAYPDLGVEQLGAVYERVLGLPDRKQSGSFYTPRALTEFVVRETLAPLTRNASADQILNLRVLDPAMGSGAFLVAACRHLAAAYERALVAEHRLSEQEIDDQCQADFRRLVAQRCLYGVDKNPTAVELARLSLWLATLSRGKPLSFLDHRLRAGDALVGARPDDLRHVTGRRRSRAELPLLDVDSSLETATSRAVVSLRSFDTEADDSLEAVRRKEHTWAHLCGESSSLHQWRLASDLWCAQWFAGRDVAASAPELRAAIDALVKNDRTLPAGPLARWLRHARDERERRGFFHWPLEFAGVFFDAEGRTRSDAGFDAIIGNPPWEMLRADHGGADDAARLVRFIRDSGVYALTGRGHMNLYQPFLERALGLARRGGRVGLLLPWGLASDEGAAPLREHLISRCETATIAGFDNKAAIFPVHRGVRFLALVTSPGGSTRDLTMTCGITDVEDAERPGLRVASGLLARIGGRARRFPDIRQPDDLALLERLTSRFPAVGDPTGYGATFGRELNVTEDKHRFGERGLPVIEGKHIQPFVTDASSAAFRISSTHAAAALPGRPFDRPRLAYRDVSAVGNRHALIAAIVPMGVVTTHTIFCLKTPLPLEQQHFLCACFNSEILNRFVRLLMGGHLTTNLVESLPVPPWTGTPRQRKIAHLAGGAAGGEELSPLLLAEFGDSPITDCPITR